MSIDEKTVVKIARLARIHIPEAERASVAQEMSGILGWIAQLQEVNTDGIEALASVSPVTLPRRADVVTEGNQQDAILKNAPASEHGCFVVPKVVE